MNVDTVISSILLVGVLTFFAVDVYFFLKEK